MMGLLGMKVSYEEIHSLNSNIANESKKFHFCQKYAGTKWGPGMLEPYWRMG